MTAMAPAAIATIPAALVMFHDVRGQVFVARSCIGLDRLVGWQGLEPKFAHEARVLVPIGTERLASVPDLPIVGIPARLPVGVGERDPG